MSMMIVILSTMGIVSMLDWIEQLMGIEIELLPRLLIVVPISVVISAEIRLHWWSKE